jgi:hypothetical protein
VYESKRDGSSSVSSVTEDPSSTLLPTPARRRPTVKSTAGKTAPRQNVTLSSAEEQARVYLALLSATA